MSSATLPSITFQRQMPQGIGPDGMAGAYFMNALSMDLRQRVLNHALTHSLRDTAETFKVCLVTVINLKKLYFETGSAKPRERKKLPPGRHITPAGELYLRTLVLDDCDATLAELCDRYFEAYRIRVSQATLSTTLRRMGLTRKKKRSATPRGTATGSRACGPSTPRTSRASRKATASTSTRRAAP